MLNIKPCENTCLYGLNEYLNEIIDLYNKKTMPNKILFSGKKGVGKSTLSYHLINYILSSGENLKYDLVNHTINKENKSYKLIQNNIHPNFHLVDLLDEKKIIDITQIRKMITYANKSSLNDLPRIILIDNVECLNKNSNNALLKVIEEPNENVFFILIHNNEKNILQTLKSRCLTFKINISFDKFVNISNSILKDNIYDLMNHDLLSYYNTPGEIVNLINFTNEKKINLKDHNLNELLKLFIDKAYYKKNKFIKSLMINFIELFFLKEYKISKTKNSLLNLYHNIIKNIYNTEKFNLDEESLFLEFKSKILNE